MRDYREYNLNRREIGFLIAGSLIVLGSVGFLFYDTFLAVVLIIPLFPMGKKKAEKVLCELSRRKFRIRFRDFLYCLSSSFASGRHMKEALREARVELATIYTEQDMIVTELDHMLGAIRSGGQSEIAVLTNLAERTGLEDVNNFVRIYQACRETGGNIAAAMERTARVIGEKITIENEIRVIVQQKKSEGMIITVMPVLIILFLRSISPDYLEVMYTSFEGKLLMTIAMIGIAGAYLWIERITSIDV